MRKRTPTYDLRGDKRKAKKWIPWSQQQIERLKDLNAANAVNKVLRPAIGVGVLLRSVGGYDFIRIVVSAKRECKISFTTEIVGLTVTFTSKFVEPASKVFWDFGDGEYSTALNPVHTYDVAGNYTVTAKGYAPADYIDGSPRITPFVIGSAERKFGGHPASNVQAYADFVADSWVSSGVKTNEYTVSWQASPEKWDYTALRLNATIPLQDFIGKITPGKAIIYVTGQWLSYTRRGSEGRYPVVEEASGSTGLGLNMRESSTSPQENIAGEINSNIPLVETVVRAMDSSATDPYGILPDPKPTYSSEGWVSYIHGTTQIGRLNVLPFSCINVKSQTLTV